MVVCGSVIWSSAEVDIFRFLRETQAGSSPEEEMHSGAFLSNALKHLLLWPIRTRSGGAGSFRAGHFSVE